MIFLEKPEQFVPKFEVVSCFIEHNTKILLLHRQDHKPQGGTWGVPAGKIEEGEDERGALVREIKEELGLVIERDTPDFVSKVYVKFEQYDFPYHMFRLKFLEKPLITVNFKDHKRYAWVSPKEALDMNLIQDEDACIKLVYFQGK